MKKSGVSTTKIKQKIKSLIPEHYHAIAFNMLEKLKILDKTIYKLHLEIQELKSLIYEVKNGNQSFKKKDPLLEAYESQIKLYNNTLKELMNYIRFVQMIENRTEKPPDGFEEEMKELDANFRK